MVFTLALGSEIMDATIVGLGHGLSVKTGIEQVVAVVKCLLTSLTFWQL